MAHLDDVGRRTETILEDKVSDKILALCQEAPQDGLGWPDMNIRLGKSNKVHMASPMNLVKGQRYTMCGLGGKGVVTDEPITCEACMRFEKRMEG